MRLFLVICILIGIICPTMVIYSTQYNQKTSFVEVYQYVKIPIIAVEFTTPIPTPIPTKPDFCVDCINYQDFQEPFTLSTGEYFNLRTCYDSKMLQNSSQVEQFMKWDTINQIPFHFPEMTCGHYAQHIQNLAANNSISCWLVAIKFPNSWHSIVAFPTIDDGVLYVDPTNCDKWAYVATGEIYRSWPMEHLNVKGFQNTTVYPVVELFELYY